MKYAIQNFIKELPAGKYMAKDIHESYEDALGIICNPWNVTPAIRKMCKLGILCKEQSNEKIPGKRGVKPLIYIKS